MSPWCGRSYKDWPWPFLRKTGIRTSQGELASTRCRWPSLAPKVIRHYDFSTFTRTDWLIWGLQNSLCDTSIQLGPYSGWRVWGYTASSMPGSPRLQARQSHRYQWAAECQRAQCARHFGGTHICALEDSGGSNKGMTISLGDLTAQKVPGLVNVQKTFEHGHLVRGFTHEEMVSFHIFLLCNSWPEGTPMASKIWWV